jgi:hypothetical protein
MKLFILIMLLMPMVAQAKVEVLSVEGLQSAKDCAGADACFDLRLKTAGNVIFGLKSNTVVGRTRLVAVKATGQKSVSTLRTEKSTILDAVSVIELNAEDVCIGAAAIGCGEWMTGRSGKYRLGFDVDDDRQLSSGDDYLEISINFVP